MTDAYNLLLRRDPLTFANQAHIELHQSRLDDDWYLRVLGDDLESILSGRRRRSVINLPPGSGKTFMFSVTLPAWILGHDPSARILIVSYAEDLAIDISRKIRTILRASWFQRAFPQTILAKDHQSAREFATTAGGQVYARSIGGSTTGIHCNFLICDDLVHIRDCGNLECLESMNGKFDNELTTRLIDRSTGAIVVVQQRLHPRDLTGYLQNRQGWNYRVLPLIAPEDCDYPLKNGVWHRKKGNVLRSGAYTPEIIAELRENTGAPGFGPLYQQSFDGPDVLQIRREDFIIQPYYAPPAVPFVFSIDPILKGENGVSFGVIQSWGMLADRKYLLYDQWRGRASRSVFANHISSMIAKYRPRVILIEDNGPALDLFEQFNTSRRPVILVQPQGNKLSRLRRHLDLFRNGRVVLRANAPFINEFLTEHEQIPYGTHYDQVDSETQFFDFAESNDPPPISPQPPSSMGALGSIRKAREELYWNAGRPTRYVFSRR